ncbi:MULTISPECIES: DUF935 domain-containing protein [unclassified Maridesulfovibrio]|uniref:DUF935 domain-containing protein n=1 Tax=unclassified Maridesulfovibrio TaxID=2794999 RepID=UPI003B3F8771
MSDRPELIEFSADDTYTIYDTWIGDIIPNEDSVLASLGGDLEEYSKLLRDHEVQSCYQQRRDAVIACDWTVTPGAKDKKSQMAAESLNEYLNGISWDRKTRMMLSGVFHGYAVAECMWAKDGSNIALDQILVRKQRRFGFGKDMRELRLYDVNRIKSEAMPERKFWVASFGADDDDSPYGRGLGHYLWWPVFLKRNGAKYWAIYLDKFGSPSVKAKYPNNATEKQKRVALQAAKALRQNSASAFPEGFDLELLSATGSGTGSYLSFMSYWDIAIAKIILSQTGTTNAGAYVGTANVHKSVRLDVVRSDADLLCESFNTGPACWLTEWNYPGATPPKVSRIVEDSERVGMQIDRDTKIYAMGFELTEEACTEKYGSGWVKRKENPAPASFAEQPVQRDPAEEDDVELISGQLDQLTVDGMDDVINQVRGLLDQAEQQGEGLDYVAEQLLQLYPGMDMSGISELVGQAMSVAYLQGADDVKT